LWGTGKGAAHTTSDKLVCYDIGAEPAAVATLLSPAAHNSSSPSGREDVAGHLPHAVEVAK